MKKLMVVLFLIAGLLINSTVLLAAGNKQRNHAKHAINRTAVVLIDAQKCAVAGGKYAGLGRAVGQQMIARDLFRQGHYQQAIQHTLRSRTLAVKIIKLNNRKMIREAKFDRIEKKYMKKTPKEISDTNDKAKSKDISDADAVKVKVDVDID